MIFTDVVEMSGLAGELFGERSGIVLARGALGGAAAREGTAPAWLNRATPPRDGGRWRLFLEDARGVMPAARCSLILAILSWYRCMRCAS